MCAHNGCVAPCGAIGAPQKAPLNGCVYVCVCFVHNHCIHEYTTIYAGANICDHINSEPRLGAEKAESNVSDEAVCPIYTPHTRTHTTHKHPFGRRILNESVCACVCLCVFASVCVCMRMCLGLCGRTLGSRLWVHKVWSISDQRRRIHALCTRHNDDDG